jgi:hypothetical protein
MAFDFPSNPTIGQIVTGPGGIQYQWDGVKWIVVSGSTPGGGASVTVGPTPPASPAQGYLWWNTNDGNLYIYYIDANSAQWVIANAANPYMPEAPTDGRDYLRQGSSQTWVPGLPLQGVVNGSNAPSGQIGEAVLGLNTAGTPLTSGVVAVITSVSLTAGDWDVSGEVWFASGTASTGQYGAITTGTGFPGTPAANVSTSFVSSPSNLTVNLALSQCRQSLSATTTVNLLALENGGSGWVATGRIAARRVR